MANEEHFEILKQGVEAWNKWRKENPDVKPDLREAILSGANLRRANLSGANLWNANLREADLTNANLGNAVLVKANLCKANLCDAHLCDAHLFWADLRKANLNRADLSKANLYMADLSGADLDGADLYGTNLSGANLYKAKLQGAAFSKAIVDGETLVSDCQVDRDTNFELVGLGDIRIDSGILQLLEYNIRRKRWEQWFEQGHIWKRIIKKSLVRGFWWMSDYGLSTKRIVLWFIILSLLFAEMYRRFPGWLVVKDRPEGIKDFLHACYFSIVTMTTLGFGDIHAHPDSHAGQIILMTEVLLGYIMLGAVLTRFAVLFTAGGPAGKFVPMSKEEKRKLKDIREKQRQEGAEENKQDDEIIEGV